VDASLGAIPISPNSYGCIYAYYKPALSLAAVCVSLLLLLMKASVVVIAVLVHR
jgi:hypothetical protein